MDERLDTGRNHGAGIKGVFLKVSWPANIKALSGGLFLWENLFKVGSFVRTPPRNEVSAPIIGRLTSRQKKKNQQVKKKKSHSVL